MFPNPLYIDNVLPFNISGKLNEFKMAGLSWWNVPLSQIHGFPSFPDHSHSKIRVLCNFLHKINLTILCICFLWWLCPVMNTIYNSCYTIGQIHNIFLNKSNNINKLKYWGLHISTCNLNHISKTICVVQWN